MIDDAGNKSPEMDGSVQKDSPTTTRDDAAALDKVMDEVLGSATTTDTAAPDPTTGVPEKTATPVPQPSDKTVPQPAATPEVKPVEPPKPAESTPAPEVPAASAVEPGFEDIDKIPEPKGLAPARAQQWKDLRNVARESRKRELAMKQELETIKPQIEQLRANSGKLPEEVSKELDEHRQFRAAYDLQNNPEFTEKYFKPMQGIETRVASLLEEHGMSKDALENFKKVGIMGTPKESWNQILNALGEADPLAKGRLEKMLTDFYSHAEGYQTELADAPNKIKAYEEKRKQEAQKKESDYQSTVNREIDNIRKGIPQIQPKEVPPNATPEQKAEIEKHNKKIEQIEQNYVATFRAVRAGDPVAITQTVAAALMAIEQASELKENAEKMKALEGRNQQLEQELAQIRGASQTSRSIVSAKAVKQAPTTSLSMSDSDAVENLMKELGV